MNYKGMDSAYIGYSFNKPITKPTILIHVYWYCKIYVTNYGSKSSARLSMIS